ncbi:Transcriptional regulatory protein pro1 [Ceratocystis lukuohia]|uniref:Transcriptional regulatory protein pro1 n=1 Tax=Ceratocystis lukuohia TaxID=2019550 RepID=A0ABR4MMC8_9PEZI
MRSASAPTKHTTKSSSLSSSLSSSSPLVSSSASASAPAMAVAPMSTASAKAKASKTSSSGVATGNGNGKSKTQMHRRLRRKKCDEGTPLCTACKHLGLTCEYKRPMWWSNNDMRRKQKEEIKIIIKRKKMSEKSARPMPDSSMSVPMAMPMPMSMSVQLPMTTSSPPLLSHSVPTSTTFSDPMDRDRSSSIDSQFSVPDPATGAMSMAGFSTAGFSSPPDIVMFGNQPSAAYCNPELLFGTGSGYAPYEIDIKTERQMFVDDVPTMRESTVSTFSSFNTPPQVGGVLGPDWESSQHVFTESSEESLGEGALGCNFFNFEGDISGIPSQTSCSTLAIEVELDENDQVLLDHFIKAVLPTIFPILDSSQQVQSATDLILPALQANKCYLHCCLSIAAQHLKATQGANPELDEAITNHLCQTVSMLCRALSEDEAHGEVLDVTLALVFFQCVVGTIDESLSHIPWHQHVQAAMSVASKLGLPAQADGTINEIKTEESSAPSTSSSSDAAHEPFASVASASASTSFNTTLLSWIDILGATMKGQAPAFAHTYREKHLAHPASSLGLRDLMGCEDRVMYLISEIACLEALKTDGMDDISICQHVHVLGDQITMTEQADGAAATPKSPYTVSGALSPQQLSRNVTAAFRLAARIYLCSLVPGFAPSQTSCIGLVEKLTNVLQFIPPGYDRSLAWVYLVGGSVALPQSSFRAVFEGRMGAMGEQAHLGAISQVVVILHEVWSQTEAAMLAQAQSAASGTCGPHGSEALPYIHWRDVMAVKGWDLLIM